MFERIRAKRWLWFVLPAGIAGLSLWLLVEGLLAEQYLVQLREHCGANVAPKIVGQPSHVDRIAQTAGDAFLVRRQHSDHDLSYAPCMQSLQSDLVEFRYRSDGHQAGRYHVDLIAPSGDFAITPISHPDFDGKVPEYDALWFVTPLHYGQLLISSNVLHYKKSVNEPLEDDDQDYHSVLVEPTLLSVEWFKYHFALVGAIIGLLIATGFLRRGTGS